MLLNALKFHLKFVKVIKFSKPEIFFSKKLKLMGGYPPHVKFMLGVNPPPPTV
jgi:hypothetical protein